MIKTFLVISILSLLSFSQINFCSKSEVPKNDKTAKPAKKLKKPEPKYNEIKVDKILEISQINKQKPMTGTFETKGFVVKITDCPACPPDAICKPCMAENILVSEEYKKLDKYDLTDKELIIFTKDSEEFEVGKEYNFKVKITDKRSTSAELNDVQLASAKLIED